LQVLAAFLYIPNQKLKEEMPYGSKEAYENRPDPVRADAEDARFLEWTESGNTGHSKQEGVHPQSQAQGSGRMTLLYTDV
jgi:hypothetical protein